MTAMGVSGRHGVGVQHHAALLARRLRLTATVLEEAARAFLGGAPMLSTTPLVVQRGPREVHNDIEDHLNGVDEAPSPSRMRAILAELHTNAGVEEMADLARRVANIAHARAGNPPVGEPVAAILESMSRTCVRTLLVVATALETRAMAGPAELAGLDAAYSDVRSCRRRLFAACAHAPLTVAADASVVGRCYERFAECTVSVADQVRPLTETGSRP